MASCSPAAGGQGEQDCQEQEHWQISVLVHKIRTSGLEFAVAIFAILADKVSAYDFAIAAHSANRNLVIVNSEMITAPRASFNGQRPVRTIIIVVVVRTPHAPIRAGGNPGLNLSSKGHGADQGERHQNGGKEAEETMGGLRFQIVSPFNFLFCGTALEKLRRDDCWEAAYHTGISSFSAYLLGFGNPVSCCNVIIPHPMEKVKSVSCK